MAAQPVCKIEHNLSVTKYMKYIVIDRYNVSEVTRFLSILFQRHINNGSKKTGLFSLWTNILVWLLVKLQNNTDVLWLQYWIHDKHSAKC